MLSIGSTFIFIDHSVLVSSFLPILLLGRVIAADKCSLELCCPMLLEPHSSSGSPLALLGVAALSTLSPAVFTTVMQDFDLNHPVCWLCTVETTNTLLYPSLQMLLRHWSQNMCNSESLESLLDELRFNESHFTAIIPKLKEKISAFFIVLYPTLKLHGGSVYFFYQCNLQPWVL